MAEIRLNKLTRQFNIGLQTLVDFLNEKGAGVDLNPNAKVSDSFLPDLERKFGEDLRAKQDAEKVDIKMKEIIEKNTRRQQDDEDFEPVRETIITSTSLSSKPEKEETLSEEAPKAKEPAPVEEIKEPEVQESKAAEPVVEETKPEMTEETVAEETPAEAPAEAEVEAETAPVEAAPAAEATVETPVATKPDVENKATETVSYTHLTLPTTPYV